MYVRRVLLKCESSHIRHVYAGQMSRLQGKVQYSCIVKELCNNTKGCMLRAVQSCTCQVDLVLRDGTRTAAVVRGLPRLNSTRVTGQ